MVGALLKQDRTSIIARLSLALLVAGNGCGGADEPNRADNPVTGGAGGGEPIGIPGLCPEDDPSLVRPASWSVNTHCPGVDANYDEVFDASVVRQLTITLDPAAYQSMLDFIEANYENVSGDLDALPNPPWVAASVSYKDHVWDQVGFRFKGHASLAGARARGMLKFAFKLRFDEFEDENPSYLDQRFFGFRTLNFANAYNDRSYIRDKTASDMFRAAGVPAARASFVAVYLDIGEGPFYHGLHTIIEDPSDRMLDNQLADGSGNLYKPWGEPGRWLSASEAGGEDAVRMYFEKKTNEDASDWTDVFASLTALHSDRSDPMAWRAGLEATFDVRGFLRAMAMNQVMVNWDSYGCKPHNYYVYADPLGGGVLRWIPWDLNEAMMTTTASSGCRDPSSILLDEIVEGDPSGEIDTNWPLISLILGDAEYRADYIELVREVFTTVLDQDSLAQQMQADYDLIGPYVIGPVAEEVDPYQSSIDSDFAGALTNARGTGLIDHINQRRQDVATALAELDAAAP